MSNGKRKPTGTEKAARVRTPAPRVQEHGGLLDPGAGGGTGVQPQSPAQVLQGSVGQVPREEAVASHPARCVMAAEDFELRSPRFWWRVLERFGLATLVAAVVGAAFWYWSQETKVQNDINNKRNNDTIQALNKTHDEAMSRAWGRVRELEDRLDRIEHALILVHPRESTRASIVKARTE